MLDYIPWSYAAERLNEAFPAMWSFEYVGEPKIVNEQVIVKVRLTTPLGTQEAWGAHAYEPGKNRNANIGDSTQSAGHKALRRAASHWGIGLDLYGSEEDTIEVDSEVLNARAAFKSAVYVLNLSMEQVLGTVSEQYDQTFTKISEAVDLIVEMEQVDEVVGIWRIINILGDKENSVRQENP